MSKDSTNDLYDLISQISVFALGKKKPDAVTVRRMKNTAMGFVKNSAANAATARGLIACIEGNYDESVKQHTLAMRLDKSPYHVMHYAASLRTLGHHGKSYSLMQCVMAELPDPMWLLSSEISMAYETGHYIDVLRFHDEIHRIKLENVPDSILLFVYFSKLLLDTNVDPYAFPIIIKLMQSIHEKYHTEPIDTYAIEYEEYDLLYWVETTADEQTVAVMNAELAAEIALLTEYNLDYYRAGFRTPQAAGEINSDKLHKVLLELNAERTQSSL